MSDFLHPAESAISSSATKQKRTKKNSKEKKSAPSVSDGMGVNLMSEIALKAVVVEQEKKS